MTSGCQLSFLRVGIKRGVGRTGPDYECWFESFLRIILGKPLSITKILLVEITSSVLYMVIHWMYSAYHWVLVSLPTCYVGLMTFGVQLFTSDSMTSLAQWWSHLSLWFFIIYLGSKIPGFHSSCKYLYINFLLCISWGEHRNDSLQIIQVNCCTR